MTDDEIRIEIAKLHGWTDIEFTLNLPCGIPPAGRRLAYCILETSAKKGKFWLPDYLNDLNAMAEAYSTCIAGDRVLVYRFENELHEIIVDGCKDIARDYFPALQTNATARQRAIAMVKTLGKWKDK